MTTETTYPHVTHGPRASELACELRGESHESLACLAANMVAILESIARACAPGVDQSDDEIANVRELASTAAASAVRS